MGDKINQQRVAPLLAEEMVRRLDAPPGGDA